MRISDVQVDGFGVWSGLTVDDISSEMSVFYGPNEAGKTTLMQFVRTVLYGLSEQRRERYLPPVHGGAPGGLLRVREHDDSFTVRRRLPERDDPSAGHLDVIAHDGRMLGRAQLEALLSGIDESIFNNVFAVGLRELQELGTLNDTDAADQLYRLTTGLDRVSLVDVMRELVASRRRLLGDTEKPTQLGRLIAQRDRLRVEIEDASQKGQRWAQLSAQTIRLQGDVVELEQKIRDAELQSKLVDTALQVRPSWLERRRILQRIDELGAIPRLPHDIVNQVEDTNTRIVKRREKQNIYRRQMQTILDEGKSQPIKRAVWAAKTRIEAVCEYEPWIASLEDQIRRFEPEVTALEAELHTKYEQSGLPNGVKYSELPDLSRRCQSLLRGPGKRIYQEQRRLKRARDEKALIRRETESVSQQLVGSLSDLGYDDLDAAMDTVAERLNDLRRRMKIHERLEKMERHLNELEDDHEELLEAQVLPMQSIAVLAVPFIISCTCLLSLALWGIDSAGGIVLMVLGMCGLIGTMLLKLWMERNAREELEDCEHQIETLKEQIEKTHHDRDELDRRLPVGGGPIEVRLKAAEDELARLERLIPMEAERKAALERDEAGDVRAERANASLEAAQDRWRQALEDAGLPDTLTTRQVRELSRGFERIADTQAKLEARREELRQRKSDYAAITSRIDHLVREVGLTTKHTDPQTRLRELSSAVAAQAAGVDRRRVLKKQFMDFRRSAVRCRRVLERLEHRRSTLLASAGATDESDLRRLVARVKQHDELVAEQKGAERQMTNAVGSQFRQDEILALLDDQAHQELDRRAEKLSAELKSLRGDLSQLHQRRGELNHELKTLAEDRRLDHARLELACVEKQIDETARRWRTLAVTELILESVRAVYEKERQPETLQQASEYLTALTDGNYRRVWTPLGSDRLKVDNRDNESLPVEVLSRGTREAVFLSLRLALVAQYAKRSAALPLVLDDILVNFDGRRAKLAARVLRDFAIDGCQIMMFTCHEHIVKLFQSVRAEIRTLPDHHDPTAERALPKWDEPVARPAAAIIEPKLEELEPVVYEPVEAEPAEISPVAVEPVEYEPIDEEPIFEPVVEAPVVRLPIVADVAPPTAPRAPLAVADELDEWIEEAPLPPPPTVEIDEYEDYFEPVAVEVPPADDFEEPPEPEHRARIFTWEPPRQWTDNWADNWNEDNRETVDGAGVVDGDRFEYSAAGIAPSYSVDSPSSDPRVDGPAHGYTRGRESERTSDSSPIRIVRRFG